MPWKKWQPGEPITINRIIWNGLESEFIQDVLERDWFGPGEYVRRLEKEIAKFIGVEHGQLLNSGSSALLLATRTLQQLGLWQPGDLILHPACTFPTSCNPIWQSGMVPIFVDVEEGTYNIDAGQIEQALQKYPLIRGALIPHLLGNSPEMDRILTLLDGRPLIEDCCDTLGSQYDDRMAGSFGLAAAFSFYGSHHISTAGVGGALMTDLPEIYHFVHSMAFWGRQFFQTGDPYLDFSQRYTYETIGYDMQMSEIQAAFGLAQFSRLDELNRDRVRQFHRTDEFMQPWSDWLVLPGQHPKADPSWFGYPILIRESAPFERENMARHLLSAGIEIRPLFAGNLTRQPAYRHAPYLIAGNLAQSDRNMERALFLPAWGGMTGEMTAHLFGVIEEFMKKW